MKFLFSLCFSLLFFYGYAQNVGIGTNIPIAKLHVLEGTVAFTANSFSNTPGPTPFAGPGVATFWYPDKGAFRTGGNFYSGWTTPNIGYFSFSSGLNAEAAGSYSVAMGQWASSPGFAAIALGQSNLASGNYSTAIGVASYAAGLASIAIGTTDTSTGGGSVAMGDNSRATQDFAIAIGRYATATNYSAISLGEKNISTGGFSFSTGLLSRASGEYAAVFGNTNFAKANGGFTTGLFNDSTDSPDNATNQGTDRVFQVGNGTANDSRSNALTLLRNSRLGIGTSKPLARLHVADSSVVFTMASIPATAANPPVSGGGVRMMWYADKAAFRVGATSGTEWDKDNIGNYSVAGGFGSSASGATAFAMGNFAFATGVSASSLGFSVFAKAKAGTTLGIYNDITDNPDPLAEASTDRLFQIGNGTANNSRRNALTILRSGNMGIGNTNPATKLDITGGNNWDLSNTEGDFRIGNASYRIKMGIALDGGGAGSATIRSAGGIERLNLGTNNTNIITMNGTSNFVGIGIETPSQKLHVIGNILASGTITPSDARFKKDIELIQHPLQKLEQLSGVTYHYRTDEFPANGFDKQLQVGLIAQQVEKVFPQLVFTDPSGYKAVDYPKLIPLLIEAMKEQQREIGEMKKLIEQLLK